MPFSGGSTTRCLCTYFRFQNACALWCIIAHRIYYYVYISPDLYRFQNEQETIENFAFGLDWNGSHTSTAHIRVYVCCCWFWFTKKCIFKPFFSSNGIMRRLTPPPMSSPLLQLLLCNLCCVGQNENEKNLQSRRRQLRRWRRQQWW